MQNLKVGEAPFKIGEYIKIRSGSSFRLEIKKGKIYRIVEVAKCWETLIPPKSCWDCNTKGWRLRICCQNFDIIETCFLKIEKYKGAEENTACYNCEDKIFCIINMVKDEIV